jgi:hypothetical protein
VLPRAQVRGEGEGRRRHAEPAPVRVPDIPTKWQ